MNIVIHISSEVKGQLECRRQRRLTAYCVKPICAGVTAGQAAAFGCAGVAFWINTDPILKPVELDLKK